MKVDLPTFLVGVFLFVGAVGMMSYLIFALLFDDTNIDDFPIENLVFGFGLMILALCIMFYMGSYFISTSQINESSQHNFSNVERKQID